MLTADGCRSRRARLWDALGDRAVVPALVLTDPVNLRYLANFYVDPFSLGADFGGVLAIDRDGKTTLYHDRRLPESVQSAHADERKIVPWYDGQTPGIGPRRLALASTVAALGGRIHDCLCDPLSTAIHEAIASMRRAKDADEVEALRACMRASEAGQAWGLQNARAGMTELDVYNGIFAACATAEGRPSIIYGDFAVSPGSARRGGPPTGHVLQKGETLILDFSVVLSGYRSDFTNTLVVGGNPSPEQTRLSAACQMAMAAGEYVSVSSQADTERADLELERRALATNEPGERAELAAIYVGRGLTSELAEEVATQLMARDALGAHARDEIGLSDVLSARPLQAAAASAVSFATGALFPVLLCAIASWALLTPLVFGSSLVLLAVLGGFAARTGGASMLPGALRVALWGGLAMAITAAVGRLFHAAG